MKFELVGRDRGAQAARLHPETVIGIDDVGHRFEGLADLACDLAAGLGVGAVDFGQERGDDRRAGGRFDGLERGAGGHIERQDTLANVERDVVGGALAVVLGLKVDLHVAHLRLIAQVVMPHQPVEVEGCGGAGMGLGRDHFGQVQNGGGDLLCHGVGGLDAGALGQVDDHAELGLVVKRQQLDRDVLGVEQPERAEGKDDGDQQEQTSAPDFVARIGRATTA